MPELPLDTWEMNHIEARRAIEDLPADADFQAVREREEAREKGPRPSVLRAIDLRESPDADPPQEARPDRTVQGELSPAAWTEHDWRGHRLYKCRYCPGVQSFEVGVIYDHARRYHPNG